MKLRPLVIVTSVGVAGGIVALAVILFLSLAFPRLGTVSAINGTCNTTLSFVSGFGETALNVGDPAGCDIGDSIVINQGSMLEECREITNVVGSVLYIYGPLTFDHAVGETVVEVSQCPAPAPGPTEPPPPGLGQMHYCPEPGRWSIATWSGQDNTPTGDALASCPQLVDAAYRIDPDAQTWTRYFRGRPEISNLSALDNGQGVIALGAGVSAASTPSDEALLAMANGMLGCPQAAKWAISVWTGADSTGTAQALATCGAGAVAAAYYLDPQTQGWLRWFAGRPEISNLLALDNMQGVIALGATGAPPPTPTATPAPTPIPSARILFASYRDGNWEVYVMNDEGSDQSNLTSHQAWDYDPAWSPDGTRIAFGSNRDGYSDIWVMSARGTGQTNLTKSASSDGCPAWSPVGSLIAFHSDRDALPEIYLMNEEGANLTRLTNNSAVDSCPTWSPDGSRIAFESERDGNLQIYRMNADGTGATNLSNTLSWDSQPAWSPDGSRIAFVSDRDGNGEIYVMTAEGSDVTRLTNEPAQDYSPAWSADGSRLVFGSDRDGNEEVYVMNADGSDVRRLTTNPAQDTDPAWSPTP